MTKTGGLHLGSQDSCKAFLRAVIGHYVYVLRRPDGRAFYVGKGFGSRVFSHENEARHPNDWRSNAYKLNVIRSIWKSGKAPVYEIDFISADEATAFRREAELIGALKRLHEGGPLTNLHPGGGTIGGLAPASKEKHTATLGGIPDDNPDRAILNGFVLSIGKMQSVVLKPLKQFIPRPTRPGTRPYGVTFRSAVALVAAAAASSILMDEACQIPRRVTVQGVDGFVENGVASAIIKSEMATLVEAQNPVDEAFNLTTEQGRKVVGLVGLQKCVDLGVLKNP